MYSSCKKSSSGAHVRVLLFDLLPLRVGDLRVIAPVQMGGGGEIDGARGIALAEGDVSALRHRGKVVHVDRGVHPLHDLRLFVDLHIFLDQLLGQIEPAREAAVGEPVFQAQHCGDLDLYTVLAARRVEVIPLPT